MRDDDGIAVNVGIGPVEFPVCAPIAKPCSTQAPRASGPAADMGEVNSNLSAFTFIDS